MSSEAELLRTEAPAGWQVKRIKSVAAPAPGAFTDGDWIESPYITDQGVRLLQTGNIGVGHFKEQGYRYISDETFRLLRCTEVRPRDVLICRLADPVGRACIAPDLGLRMITSVDVAILKPRIEHDPRFLVYYLSSERYLGHLEAICRGGTRDRVSRSMLGDIPILAPPKAEQRAIAAFLDHKTAAINALIAKKERLIELLQEKRQALITQAVTKGLDPNVPMKESGVEWLHGSVPSHWQVVSLRRLARVEQGSAFAHFRQGREAGDFPWFKVADMNRKGNEVEMRSADNYVSREVAREAGAALLPAGAVAFPRVGAALLTNKRRLLAQPSIIDDNTYALLPSERVRSRYLYLAMLLVDMGSLCSPGLVPTVTFGAVKDLRFPLPPIDEQDRIVLRVEAQVAALTQVSERTAASIERLREYRQALITAAVTGKIDLSKEAT